MNRCHYIAAVLVLPLLLGSDSPERYDGATESDPVAGTWRVVAMEVGGRNTAFRKYDYNFRGGLRTANSGDGKTYRGTYRLDTSRSPAQLDLLELDGPFKGKTRRYIFRLDGDTVQMCETLGGVVRPAAFGGSRDTVLSTLKHKR